MSPVAGEQLAARLGRRRRVWLADLVLMLAGVMWGVTFPLMKYAQAHTSAANLLFLRFALAWLALAPVALWRRRSFTREHLAPGLLCGFFLFLAFMAQAISLDHTLATRAGFITGFYVVLVPLFSLLFFRVPPGRLVLVGAGVSLLGLYLLTSGGHLGSLPLNLGDAMALGCAVFAAAQITTLGRFAPGLDAFWLAFMQFSVVTAGAALWAALDGSLTLAVSRPVWWAVWFLALGCTVGAFWGQSWAQTYTTPARSAVIFMLEPVVGAILSYLWLGERLGAWGIAGAVLILLGILLAELKPRPWHPHRTRHREDGRD